MGHNGVWVGLKNSWNTVKLVVMWLQVGTIDSNPVISSIMYFGALFFFLYIYLWLCQLSTSSFSCSPESLFSTHMQSTDTCQQENPQRKWYENESHLICFLCMMLFLYVLNWMQLMKNTVKSQHSHITRWEQRMFRDFVWRITQTLNQPSKYFIISALDRCTVTNVIYLPWSSDFITQTADVAFLVFRSVI